jgi:hypothetical protein
VRTDTSCKVPNLDMCIRMQTSYCSDVCLLFFEHGHAHRRPATALTCVCISLSIQHKHIKLLLWRVLACVCVPLSMHKQAHRHQVTALACVGVCWRAFEHAQASTRASSYCSGACSGLACFESRAGHVSACVLHSVVLQQGQQQSTGSRTLRKD